MYGNMERMRGGALKRAVFPGRCCVCDNCAVWNGGCAVFGAYCSPAGKVIVPFILIVTIAAVFLFLQKKHALKLIAPQKNGIDRG